MLLRATPPFQPYILPLTLGVLWAPICNETSRDCFRNETLHRLWHSSGMDMT